MSDLFIFILIVPIFIVTFCFILSVFVLMLAELISIAWSNVVEAITPIFYPIGEWMSKEIEKICG